MKKLFSFLAAIVTALTVIVPSQAVPILAEPTASPVTLRVGTWNIAAGTHPNLGEMSSVIAENNLEVVAVQEVDMFNNRNNVDMLMGLTSSELSHTDFAKFRNYEGGEFGIGFVSHYPILQSSASPLETYELEATKVAQRIVIEKEGKQIALYNVHLSAQTPKQMTARELRQVQFLQLANMIAKDPIEYKVIMGDFNADQDTYEFSRMLDFFNMANGRNDQWQRTYWPDDDPAMKVFSVDNILATKNIQIDNFEVVQNQLSDHYLLCADLTLSEEKAPDLRKNLALGAAVEVSSSDEGTSAFSLVDYQYGKGWTSSEASAEITVQLDHAVENAQVKLHWGEQKPSHYTLSTSISGKTWTKVAEVNQPQVMDSLSAGNARYIKLELMEKTTDLYDLREIEVFGQFNAALDAANENILDNSGFEMWEPIVIPHPLQPNGTWWDKDIWENDLKTQPWIYQIYLGEQAMTPYYMAYQDKQDKHEGECSVRVEKRVGATNEAYFKLQNYPFVKDQTYKISFWYKTADMSSESLNLKIFNVDHPIKNNTEWTHFEGEYKANAATSLVNLYLKDVSNKPVNTGTFWIDDFQIIPVSTSEPLPVYAQSLEVQMNVSRLAVNDTAQATVQVIPEDAEDQDVVWSSSNPKAATVDKNGKVSAVGRGKTLITATSTSNSLMRASVPLTVYSDKIEIQALEEAISEAETLSSENYTQGSWTRLETALTEAKALLSSSELDQDAVDAALESIKQAMKYLVETSEIDTAYEKIMNYWVNELVGDSSGTFQDPVYLENVQSLDQKSLNYLNTMKDPMSPDTSELWTDKAMNDAEMGAKVTEALDRLKMIATQYQTPQSALYQDDAVRIQILEAMEFILANKYGPNTKKGSSNWWDWEIGSPRSMMDVSFLMRDEMPTTMKQSVVKTIDRFVPKADYRLGSSLKETGANLIDKVSIVIKRAAFEGNSSRLEHAQSCMAPLFTYVTSGDGFYKDGSFIQHTSIPYNGSYGFVLLDELTNCIIMLNFTEHAVSPENVALYETFLNDSFIPFLSYGGNVLDLVRGRAVSRMAQQGDTMGMKMMGTILQYAETVDTESAAQIRAKLKTIAQEKFSQPQTQDFSLVPYSDYIRVQVLRNTEDVEAATRQSSYNVYSYMDRTVVHREDFTFTVSNSSKRMYNTEQGNDENNKGRYQGMGHTQIYTSDISQYNDHYFATVDNYRVSGVTTAHQDISFNTSGQSAWAGGTTLDGVNGVSGLILTGDKPFSKPSASGTGNDSNVSGSRSGISAYKSYFVFGDQLIFLGTGITNDGSDPNVAVVETIVDNRKIKADGSNTLIVDGDVYLSANGEEVLTNPAYAWLQSNADDAIGYVFLNPAEVLIKKETRTGTWYDVNRLAKFTDYTERTNNFLSLAVQHGQKPTDSQYAYIVLPQVSQEETASYRADEHIAIIKQEGGVHALKDLASGQIAMNFFVAGTAGDVTVDKSSAMILDKADNAETLRLAVSDPTRSLSEITITIDNVNPQHLGVLSGDAQIIRAEGSSVSLKVRFDIKDGQPRVVELGTSYDNQSINYASQANGAHAATGTSQVGENRAPAFANDGDSSTRWASDYTKGNDEQGSNLDAETKARENDQWLDINLGQKRTISQVVITWEAANAREYLLQGSLDGETYFDLYHAVIANAGKTPRTDTLSFDAAETQYLRMQGIERSHYQGGYSIFEIEAYEKVSLSASMDKAKTLLEQYGDASAFVSETVYNQLKEKVEEALAAAEALIKLGAAYEDAELARIVNELEMASRDFNAAVLHVEQVIISEGDSYLLGKNEGVQLHASILPANAYNSAIRWESSDPAVAAVNESGYVQAVNGGTAVIKAIALDNEVSAQIEITVESKVTGITIEPAEVTVLRAETVTLQAKVEPSDSNNQNVIWTSSDESVATVDENGVVTAHTIGLATMTATTEEGGYQASSTVRVSADLKGNNQMIGATATASSTVSASGVSPQGAVDQDYTTRWASNYKNITEAEAEDQWLLMELPEARTINEIRITWFSETVYGKEYQILGSMDGENFEVMAEITEGQNKQFIIDCNEMTVKFIKFKGIKRTATNGGYGIVEFEAYYNPEIVDQLIEAKVLASRYGEDLVGSYAGYQQLKTAITETEALIDRDFTGAEIQQMREALIAGMEAYRAEIVEVTGVQISQPELTLEIKTQAQIEASVTPENATDKQLIYTTSNDSIAEVDAAGLITAKRKGQAVITVTSRDGGHKATVNVTITAFTDNPPVITANNVTIALGSEFNPLDYAIVSDVEDQDLTLTSEHVIANDVNPTLAGVYHVTYKVTDSAGNEAEKTITVTVMQDPEEVTLTSEQGIKIIGLFTDTDSVEVKDLTADHEGFDRQEIVKVWQLKMGSSSRSRGLTQYEVRIPFTEKKDGIHLYRYHISYQPISDFKFEGDELVFNTTVLDGVYVITHSQPDPAPNTPSDSSDEVNSANPAVPAVPEKPKSTGSFWSSLFGNKKQTEEESTPIEEAESPAQNESKPEAPAPTAQPEKTPEVKPEEKSASSPWMLVGGTVVIVAAGAALWMLKKRK
ncbi:polysaccharide lyase family 8 super-sandwich domain-containing protein [Holdemania massiliensis]|uniref:polysaccharide lyase family 8 super-sandwich domain-containing protein n=1 Tax=Holdemania massiliensis TaxID=1468449 RepID=UPI001F05BAAC|nr:polysaccharide lyase family 8 super-sandwich domain-containing protein [Holdemania massiliensis]MCH1939411.1 Ig-like domain-containing protein [Holdemania massiliensis]